MTQHKFLEVKEKHEKITDATKALSGGQVGTVPEGKGDV